MRAKEEVLRRKGSRGDMAKTVGLYFFQRYTGLSNKKIWEFSGRIDPSTVSRASARLKEEILSEKKLSKLIAEIDSYFQA